MKKLVSLLLAAILLLSLCGTTFASPAKTAKYGDVAKGSWYENYVNQMVKAGLMNGVSDSKFDPNGTLSRAMFVTILYRAAGKPATGKPASFADVAKGSWYADGVDWAANGGVVGGYNATTFAPNDSLTREQMVTILYRWSGAEKADAAALDAFPDKADVSSYAVDAFAWAVKYNVIGGKNGKLVPKGTTTRAEACAVLARYLETVAPTREDFEKAVVAGAWAYFAKGPGGKMQYCGLSLNTFGKYYESPYHITENAMPEFGTSDTTIYSVCSDFVYKAYYAGTGYYMFDSTDYLDVTTEAIWAISKGYGGDMIRYMAADYDIDREAKAQGITKAEGKTLDETKAFITNYKENLRPGDIMDIHIGDGGHAMLYIGDGWLIDCGGKSYDMATGTDPREFGGSVRWVHNVADILVTGEDPMRTTTYQLDKSAYFVALRANDILLERGEGALEADKPKNGVYVLPASVLTREKYPVMDIDRTVSITPYGTAYTGEELTYRVLITNRSDSEQYLRFKPDGKTDYKDLVVTEKIPVGTELVPGSISAGGTYEDGMITWKVDIAAGAAADLSYKVKVTASQGKTITSGGGFVGDIPSNVIVNRVGGAKLTADVQATLKKIADTPVKDWRETYNLSASATDLDFAERVYAKAGLTLELPTVNEMVSGLYDYKSVTHGSGSRRVPYAGNKVTKKVLVEKAEPKAEIAEAAAMILPGYQGGFKTLTNAKMINEFHPSYLEAGDILVFANLSESGKVANVRVGVATGDGRMLTNTTANHIDCLSGAALDEVLWKAYAQDTFFLLRPTLTGKTLAPYAGTEPTYGDEPVYKAASSTPLTEESKAKFKELAGKTDVAYNGSNTTFVESVYAAAGLDFAQLTKQRTMVTLCGLMYRNNGDRMGRDVNEKNQYVPFYEPTDDVAQVCRLPVAGYCGGPYFASYENKVDLTVDKLEIGDALMLAGMKASPKDYWAGVYLGDGKMIIAHYAVKETPRYILHDFSGAAGAKEFADLLQKNPENGIAWSYYFVMRPSQAFADINTGKLN